MKFISLFAGIEGMGSGLERAGMQCVAQIEKDTHCQDVLVTHYPNVPKFKDVKNVKGKELSAADLICGGFPCQDLSVAGKRKGLAGERSGLWFEFHRIIKEHRPGWVVIENVPGLLSSNGGRDFAILLRGLAELRYGVAWRVLDSQYFGVAQRRRRVFIVGSLGDGRAAEVLFERESGAWDPAPSRETGKEIAGTLDAKSASSNQGSQANETDFIVPSISRCLSARPNDSFREDSETYIAFNARRTEIGAIENLSPTLNPGGGGCQSPGVAYNIQQNDGGSHKRKDRPHGGIYVNETDKSLTLGSADKTFVTTGWDGQRARIHDPRGAAPTLQTGAETSGNITPMIWEMSHADEAVRESGDIAPTLQKRMGTGGNQVPLVGVRRLTPTECERLQGFPDGWTAGQSDTQRYKQLGNAVTVNVAEWIGKRIMKADKSSI